MRTIVFATSNEDKLKEIREILPEAELKRERGVVSLVQTEQELDDPAVLDRLLNAGLDGLVMMRPLNAPLFQLLHSRIPHIVGIDTGHMPIDNIEYDHWRVSRMAVEYLYGKGHRQIGFIGGSAGEISSMMLLIGGLYLIFRKVISWHIPCAYIGTVADPARTRGRVKKSKV